MATPGRNPNRRPGGGSSQQELLTQILKEMQAASSMYADASRTTNAMAVQLAAIPDMFRTIADTITAPYMGDSSPYGARPRSGGAAPRANDNQTTRPVHSRPAPSSLHPDAVSRDLGLHAYQQHQGPGGIAGLRNRARSAAGEALHSVYGAGSANSSYRSNYDANGKVTGVTEYDRMGNAVQTHLPGSPGMQGIARRAAVSRVGAGLAEGGIGAGIKAVPGVGEVAIGLGAGYEGLKMIGDQRAQNAQYQSIYGGSNIAGMGQRVQQEGFKLGQLFGGGMTGSQSDASFQGVSSLGLSGSDRSSALNFISSNYKSMGMDPGQSLQAVSLATQSFNVSLSDLQKQLKSVTSAAKETSQNAAVLRQSVLTGTAAASQAGAGSNSGIEGSAYTAAGAAQGQAYGSLNLSAMTNSNTQSYAARSVGLSSGAYEGQSSTNSALWAQGQQNAINRAWSSVGAAALAAIKAAITAYPGGVQAVLKSTSAQAQIGMQVAASGLIPSIANLRSQITTQLGNIFGSDSSDQVVVGSLVLWYASTQMGNTGGTGFNLTATGGSATTSMQRGALSTSQATTLIKNASATDAGGPYDANNAAQDWELKNGISDPVLEKANALAGGNNLKLKFSDGKTLSLSDALKNGNYVAQIDAGTATIASKGANNGKSLQSLGISNQQNAATTGSGSGSIADGSSVTTANGVVITFAGNKALINALNGTAKTATTGPPAQGGSH